MKKLLVLAALSISAFAYPSCTMCHNGSYKDKLNEYTPAQIVSMMKQFKTQNMGTMAKIANSMSDEEIEKVAKEYGKK